MVGPLIEFWDLILRVGPLIKFNFDNSMLFFSCFWALNGNSPKMKESADADDADDVSTTLEPGRTHPPSRPGTKYVARYTPRSDLMMI